MDMAILKRLKGLLRNNKTGEISHAAEVSAHIPLSEGKECKAVPVDGKAHAFGLTESGNSKYADFFEKPKS